MEPLQTAGASDGALTGASTSRGALSGEMDAERPCPPTNGAWAGDAPHAGGSAGRENKQINCKGPCPCLGPSENVRSAVVIKSVSSGGEDGRGRGNGSNEIPRARRQ